MSMRKIYRQVARKNGVSVAEVKKEMRAALEEAYRNPPDDGVTSAFQKRVPSKGGIPTPEEFIRYAAGEIRAKLEDGEKGDEK